MAMMGEMVGLNGARLGIDASMGTAESKEEQLKQ